MGELLFLLLLPIIFYLYRLYTNYSSKEREKKIKTNNINFFENKTHFTINLIENVNTEGFYSQEVIPVDIYDEKIDSKKYTDYSGSSLSNRYHKDKMVTNFTSNVIFEFKYNSKDYKFKIKFPVDKVNISMKLYTEKFTKIYVVDEHNNDEHNSSYQSFYIDLRFLDLRGIDYIKLGNVKE